MDDGVGARDRLCRLAVVREVGDETLPVRAPVVAAVDVQDVVAVRAEVRDDPAAGLAGTTRDHHPHVEPPDCSTSPRFPGPALIVDEAARRDARWEPDTSPSQSARSGDEEAFASIARGSADRLFAVAHRILRDVGRAEDAVQQTLVTAWRELPALRDPNALKRGSINPGSCVLRRGQARVEVDRQRRDPAGRRAGDAGHPVRSRPRLACVSVTACAGCRCHFDVGSSLSTSITRRPPQGAARHPVRSPQAAKSHTTGRRCS